MNTAPQKILKEYVKSQNFTSTAEIMEAMKEMFRDVIQAAMEVELDEELGRERCQRCGGIRDSAELPQRVLPENRKDPAGRGGHQDPPGSEGHL